MKFNWNSHNKFGQPFKKVPGLRIVSLLIIILSPSASVAIPFTASYDFGGLATTGDVFSFDFDGAVNNSDTNLIEGINSLSNFRLGGISIFDPADPGIFGGSFSVILDVLSFDGTANSFIATNPAATDGIAFQTGFGALVQSNAGFGPSGFSISESFDAARWSVVSHVEVSEPSPLILLCGAILLMFWKRSRENSPKMIGRSLGFSSGRSKQLQSF